MSRAAAGRPATKPPIGVVWDDGFRLQGSVLALDARKTRPLSFVSHAHRTTRHDRVLCTDKTLRLLRRAGASWDALPLTFGRPFQLGALRLELLPAGHVLGAAQLLAESPAGRFVYCGGFQPYGSLTAEKYQARPCDVLALDCPYDAPEIVFPPPAEVRARILEWVHDTLATGHVPVLLGVAIGKGQELTKLLGDAGLPLRAHRSLYEVGKVYRELGVPLANVRPFRGTPDPREVVLFPRHLGGSAAIRKIKKVRVALVSGRAVLPGEAQRAHVDVAFPLSDHADHPGLLAMIRETGAKHVFLSPRHGADLARLLKKRGLRVTHFVTPEQLPLGF